VSALTPEQRIAELEDRVAVLEMALGIDYTAPPEWRLSRTQSRVLGMLAKTSGVVPAERIYQALYGGRLDPPGGNAVSVHVCHLRARVARFGVDIRAHKSAGYWIPAEQKARLLDA